MKTLVIGVVAVGLAGACAPLRRPVEPLIRNWSMLPDNPPAIAAVDEARDAVLLGVVERRDSVAAEALGSCAGEICDATARGELALRMNPAQVMAVTRTTPEVWTIRRSGAVAVMVPRSGADLPRDAVGDVAMVRLRGGGVTGYSYREANGTRVVVSPEDTTMRARAAWLADRLIREGDELTAAGYLEAGLARYERADMLRPLPSAGRGPRNRAASRPPASPTERGTRAAPPRSVPAEAGDDRS